jgi:hypothetical protein
MAEEVKRLTPVKEVLRELYLKSGNQCAFPVCTQMMINKDGVFIGQVAHIEAAEEGGERFNPNQKNEDRRCFSNLILFCYEHHTITNNVTEYPVERLKTMKSEHGAKFSDIVSKPKNSQIVNNPNVFNQYGNKNIQIGSVSSLTINNV